MLDEQPADVFAGSAGGEPVQPVMGDGGCGGQAGEERGHVRLPDPGQAAVRPAHALQRCGHRRQLRADLPAGGVGEEPVDGVGQSAGPAATAGVELGLRAVAPAVDVDPDARAAAAGRPAVNPAGQHPLVTAGAAARPAARGPVAGGANPPVRPRGDRPVVPAAARAGRPPVRLVRGSRSRHRREPAGLAGRSARPGTARGQPVGAGPRPWPPRGARGTARTGRSGCTRGCRRARRTSAPGSVPAPT